jgi:4-amino-4-deoxy-L-arabinose transferase-like glycosyltransferase
VKKVLSSLAGLCRETPLLWGLLAFGLYSYYAQFVVTVNWNAVELIIAQHLLDHGVYATSVDYPSALTWRPLLPTLFVTFLRLWTDDPIVIYRLFCGAAIGGLVAAMFLSARRLWGTAAGHVAAFLTVACPATTIVLIDHRHSYSHLGALLVLGPAVLAALTLLKKTDEPQPPPARLYFASGLLWGLGCLCRGELVLFCGLHFLVLLVVHFRRRLPLRPLAGYLVVFLALLIPYNLYTNHIATWSGLLTRKAIYGFYTSQGWADPPPNVGPDIEAEGYLHAERLYGDPMKNGESLFTAISHNPPAFWRRVRLNTGNFYATFLNRGFFIPWAGGAVLGLLVLLLAGRVPGKDRPVVLLLFGWFLAAHFILIFHIDARYLTIAVPPLLLLATGFVHRVFGWLRRLPRPFPLLLVVGLTAAAACGSRRQFSQLVHHRGRNQYSVAAMRSLGAHFRSLALPPPSSGNREPHIWFVFPDRSPLYPEDQFLLAYFSHTAWVNRGADGPFPRGRLYSFRDCPDDYRYVPAEKIGDATVTKGGRIVGECDNPVLGRYYLVRLVR